MIDHVEAPAFECTSAGTGTETTANALLLVQLESRTAETSRLLLRLESQASEVARLRDQVENQACEVSRLRAQLDQRTAEVDALSERLHSGLVVRARLESERCELEEEVDQLRLDVQNTDRGRRGGLRRRGDKRGARPPVATVMTPVDVPPAVADPAAESIDAALTRRL